MNPGFQWQLKLYEAMGCAVDSSSALYKRYRLETLTERYPGERRGRRRGRPPGLRGPVGPGGASALSRGTGCWERSLGAAPQGGWSQVCPEMNTEGHVRGG